MDALDQLLVACHAHSLNLFVESFLKMVQKLLECEEAELQILATQSVSKMKKKNVVRVVKTANQLVPLIYISLYRNWYTYIIQYFDLFSVYQICQH